MRSKRLLAMLLSLCLVLSCLAPTAYAVEAPADSLSGVVDTAEEDKSTVSSKENGLVASDNSAAANNTLRDKQDMILETVTRNDQNQVDWQITAGQKPALDLVQNEVPACIEELKEVSSLYAVDEVVRAIIVLEDAPLAQTHTSPLLVSETMERQLIEKQDAVIASVERTVLQGQKLNVRYQFTYLANAISIETEFANLEKIAMIKGVKSVFVTPVYNVCETVSNPNTAASGAMTGVHTVWENLGYTGEGMKIAIIDTGLDLDHPSFAALSEEMVNSNENYLSVEDVAAVLDQLNAYQYRSSIQADKLYRSTKVPYAFNYVDSNMTADHSADDQGDHGTHVAGIAAANKTEGTSVVGMAPDAQLIVMKVFGAGGGAYTDDIVAALEDAMILGCDVVNASLGSPAGFSDSGIDWIEEVYEMIANQNIVATISAGNEGTSSYQNMWGNDLNNTKNPDNATIGSPSLYANAFSIASAENSEVQTPYFTLGDGSRVFFNNNTYGYYYGYTTGMAPMIGEEVEYVVIDGLGNEEDYYDAEGNSLVEGKVAVVFRGTLNFGVKIYNAELAGAVACIIANNNTTDDIYNFMMNDSLTDAEGNEYYATIPTCLITMEDGLKMAECEAKTMCVAADTAARVVEGGQMSSFSSWGVSPDLRLVPDITGIGGNVYSCYDGGNYGLMSGTSMSAPQLAGVTALIMQYLYEKYPAEREVNDGYISDLARAILMSTADPIISTDSGVEASPRQQGAGLVNAAEAVKTNAYLTVNGGRPKAELGDSKNGVYSFTFEITNFSQEAETYTLSSSLLTEDIVDYGIGEYFMAGYDVELTGKVTFSADSVTVPAGETVEVTVNIALSDADKVMFARYWENGGYVEGFVYLDNADEYGVDLNLPFLGFYGDWTQAPVFDTAYWYENTFWELDPVDGWTDGDEYYHILWTDLAGGDWVLGFNPYSGAYADYTGQIVYDPANNSISPNGDGILDGITEMYLSLMRNAKVLTFTYTDAATGEVLHQETVTNASKTMYISAYGRVVPWLYSWYGDKMYDFSGVENGTTVLLTIDGYVDYEQGGQHSLQFPITVDTEAPALLEAYQITEEDGSHSLVVIAEDNVNLAAIFLLSPSGTTIYDADYCYDVREDGTYMATFNVDGLGTELMVCLGDYAANESYFNVTYTEAGDNLPEVDTSLLYAYRTYDDVMEYYYGYDYMFGWMAIEKPDTDPYGMAWIEPLTNDYMEYYALTAAEYVDGKIFAVDAGYNLLVMDPGLWSRNTVCNLGKNVLDMTFDDSTDSMYVLTKESNYLYLYTMDLLTGELTRVKSLGYYYYGPYAITDDDNGTLYAVKYQGSGLYTLSADNNWTMTAVQVSAGTDETTGETLYEDLVIYDSYGNKTKPNYQQGLTYADGMIYWSYFYSSYSGSVSEFIVIDTADFAYANYPIATYYEFANQYAYSTTELVGLLAMNETDYQIPAADAAVSLALDTEQVILSAGGYYNLTASWLPWNYKLDRDALVWTSDDESVATVEGGKIQAVGEGVTTVTVSYEGLTASCQVVVVNISGNVEAYNYYTGDGYYGYMIDIDLETMDYYLTSDDISPVDFVAGDYNGHDGYFYGYDMGGQFYRYDYATNEVTPLGTSLGTYPVDMAYDYSTGMMYALVLDYNTYENTLYAVNMTNGKTMELASGMGLMTLACSTDGTLYCMDASGYLCEMAIQDYSMYGMGMYLEPVSYVLDEPFGDLYLLASMCWDHNNDVILWNWCEAATMLWIDVENSYYVDLGDPSESGTLELVGMHVVPDEIPELPETAVESVTAEDMLILTGYEKVPAVTVAPFNATSQNVTLTVADHTIVEVTANGTLMGLTAGETTVTVALHDDVSGQDFETSFNVTVLDGADNMYGHLLVDVASYGGQAWIGLNPGNPGTFDVTGYMDYTIFTAEHVDGKLYTYGYDAADWTANWQFMILDEANKTVEVQIDMGEGFPYVYDMTYDYVTSTMYVLAGASEDNTELYVADMETGKLTLLMETEPLFLAIAAGTEGKLYLIENSVETMDWETWMTTLSNANLWVMDPLAGTLELVGDTGIQSNMISSMAYDYDTDTLYWTPFAQVSSYISHLAIVDTETGLATSLGTIGTAGAQVGGLYFLCDEYPEADTSALYNLMITDSKKTVVTGDTAELNVLMMPGGLDADLVWTSSNEAVATVDADGVVTGVSQGAAVITVSATYNGVTKTASCKVAVLDPDAGFLTWNSTDMGWSLINRHDYTVVTNLTEGEDNANVTVIAAIGDKVYGYDENNQFFELNTKTFQRTAIGDAIVAEEGYQFAIKDMAYDAIGDRLLVLGDTLMWDDQAEYDYETDTYIGGYWEIEGGCSLYTVDLTTGALTEIYNFADYAYVYAMSVGAQGEVYFYTTYNDDLCALDPATGEISKIVSLQNQSLYGDLYCDYSMYYDVLTDTLYMLFTSNGRFYKMVTVDVATGALIDNGYVGEITEVDWAYYGDMVAGLTFVDIPEPVYEAEIVSASLSVNGTLNLNFYTVLSEDLIATENVTMQFTVNGQTETVALDDAVIKDDYHVFIVKLAARQMADEVTAQIMLGDKAIGEAKSYSIKKYAEAKINNENSSEELVTLMKAMLNYGAAAQEFFGYNTENLANAGLADADKVLPTVDASAYKHSVEGSEEGIKAASASLEIASENTIRVYFKLTGDKTIDEYTFTVNGEEVSPVLRNGMYCVEISGIVARDLDEMFAVSVGGLTVNYSGLSYSNQVLNNANATEEKINVATALYLYAMAAEDYFAEK